LYAWSKKSATCELSHVLTPSIISSLLLKHRFQIVLQVGEQVVVIQSEIWAVRGVVKQLPVEMLQQCSSASSCMQMRIVMEEHYTGYQHSTSFFLNGPMQFFIFLQYKT
jgi:hypothetical protein